jgi:hypothetical protein
MGTISRPNLKVLNDPGSPPKKRFKNDPTMITGTIKKIEKSQYPNPTFQISRRLKRVFNPDLPSRTPVMIIPASETESTEVNTSWGRINPWMTRMIISVPGMDASRKNESIGYFLISMIRQGLIWL